MGWSERISTLLLAICLVSPVMLQAQPPAVGARGVLAAQGDADPAPPTEGEAASEEGEEEQAAAGAETAQANQAAEAGAEPPAVEGAEEAGAQPNEGEPADPTFNPFDPFDPAMDSAELRIAEVVQAQAERAAEAQAREAAAAQERARIAALEDELRRARDDEARAHQVAEQAQEALETERSAPGEEPAERSVYIPVPTGDDLGSELESLVESFSQDRSFGALLLLLLGIGFAGLIAIGLRKLRERLLPTGILPSLLAFAHLAARIIVIGLVVAFVARFLPPRMSVVLLLALGGLAVAVGWSARDVLPDLIAGVVLAFERRVRVGMWLSGGDFEGQVEHVGLRSSVLRDPRGHELTVPNRHILGTPISADAHREREQDVTLRIDDEQTASIIRARITDAVLSSPWVAPGYRPLVFRDPDEPRLWRVRARLLEPRFGVLFEGELLERAEALLALHGHQADEDAEEAA